MKQVLTGMTLALALIAAPARADDGAVPAAPDAEAPVEAPAEAPYVIEIASVSTDTIPLRPAHGLKARPPLFIVGETAIRFSPQLWRTLRRREASREIVFDARVGDTADARVIVVERHRFAGSLRRHVFERVALRAALAAFPAPVAVPDEILITPVGSEPDIFRMLLWPDVAWRLQPGENGETAMLILDDDVGLAPGQSHALEARTAEVDVGLSVFRPEKAGSEGGALEVEEFDLGTATLTTAVTVTFHGRLAVEQAR